MVTIDKNHHNHLNNVPKTNTAYPSEKETELELIKQLMEKEAQIAQTDKAINDNKKQLKHIENSKTWQYNKPFEKLTGMFSGSTKQQNEYIRHLEEKLKETEQALYDAKEENKRLILDSRKPDANKMVQAVNEAKDNGTLLEYLGDLVQQKKQHDTNYNRTLRHAARLFMNEKQDYRNLVYASAMAGLKMEDIPEFIIRAGLTNGISLRPTVSFRASLNSRMRQLQLTGSLPEWELDDKRTAYLFADELRLRRPWTSDATYTSTNLPEKSGMVIKPADGAGSRGVYLVQDINDIVDMKRSKKLDNWDDLKASMKQDLDSGWVADDEWTIEELIMENDRTPASDIKFYCFYGKVGLILEIVRYPELKYCWWTPTGERVRTGKYDENLFAGKGVTQAEIDSAAEISRKIPAPFIRIDFLRSANELVFGEFTPKPGNYDDFDEPTDKWLGDYFVEAEDRLTQDLIYGKQFRAYNRLTSWK
ncbi:ATP-grasp fold amidoligase family protein [Lentibacillus sp. CBA3610]|uniref:ATP-grasp fold amidoligase family protein n=1 Tax=Lentibacillus sp. CBA3610 TaxID=2518176 RepID=UPI0015952FA3|nr:ATP-grasp fold amidoligase family protein [Lentibacillus sp. CBA3610]QKY70433.1 teichuronopeptide biosynthesis [Lentibacillus sp. CBA3610]